MELYNVHHPPINDADLVNLYEYLTSADSGEVLQHKVCILNILFLLHVYIDKTPYKKIKILKKLYTSNETTIFAGFCGFNAPFREGRENSRHLQRANFAVQRDGEGALFVYKTRDEQTKKSSE